MTYRSLALLGALGMALPSAALAQDSTAAEAAGGWIGIRFDVSMRVARGAEQDFFAILVTDVYGSGPADLSGLLPGDRLIAVDGEPMATYEAWMRSFTGLGPGQPLRLRIVRGGGEREVTVVAGQRPQSVQPAPARDRFVKAQTRVARSIDSIFRAFVESRESGEGGLEQRTRGYPLSRVVTGGTVQGDSVTLAVTSRDSLAAQLEDAAAQARAIEQQTQAATERMPVAEEQLRLVEESVAPPAAGGGGTELRRAETVYPGEPFLLTPYILGNPVVLGGALVRDLSSELGRYFGVQSGVLITEVTGMSPAARAGFRPGDVIVSVGGEELTTVMELRVVLAEATLPIELSVIRRGNHLKLSYPNR